MSIAAFPSAQVDIDFHLKYENVTCLVELNNQIKLWN